jgi:hypothetical protein
MIAIDETMARTLWPGQSAVGRIMRACRERQVDVRLLSLEETSGLEMRLPIRQCRYYGARCH